MRISQRPWGDDGSAASRRRALVLGGGGVAGIAWETGVLAGLTAQGINLARADLLVGTSAGASVAVQICSTPVAQLYQEQLHEPAIPEPRLELDLPMLLHRVDDILATSDDPREGRRRLGMAVTQHDRVSEDERKAIIQRRLPRYDWPNRNLKIAAIRADTGDMRVFDRESGVSLVDAVAASSAIPFVWPAVTIDGIRYYDGAIRSATNIDIAQGYGRVLVIEAAELPDAVDLRPIEANSRVFRVVASSTSKTAIGTNMLDPASRPSAARAGYQQGLRMAQATRAFWGD